MTYSTYKDEFDNSLKDLMKNKDDKESKHYDAIVYSVFNTDSGRELLKLLKYYFIEAPVSPLNLSPRYADQREGANEFIRNAIMGAIDRHRERISK